MSKSINRAIWYGKNEEGSHFFIVEHNGKRYPLEVGGGFVVLLTEKGLPKTMIPEPLWGHLTKPPSEKKLLDELLGLIEEEEHHKEYDKYEKTPGERVREEYVLLLAQRRYADAAELKKMRRDLEF